MSKTIEELKKVNKEYTENEDNWNLYNTAYKGSRAIIKAGYIKQHARESDENYLRRMNEAYGFSYSRSIVDMLSYFLLKEKSNITIPEQLQASPLWEQFEKDCDLYNTSLESFFSNSVKRTSIYGHIAIIVDKPNLKETIMTVKEEEDLGVYPYCSIYNPLNILDWEEKRDQYSRPSLSMLKLREQDGNIKIWYVGNWELWKDPDSGDDYGEEAVLLDSGINPLGKIPVVFLRNIEQDNKYMGDSDITDIAHIDMSIIRNLSQGEEVVDYSAFPMLRKPYEEEGGEGDIVGITSLLEFDPELPNSKPDWLEAECKQPIEALQLWIKQKVEEIYRLANVGGIKTTGSSQQEQSGVAKKIEFQILNSKLIQKAKNAAKAMQGVIELWLMWQGQTEYIADVSIMSPKTFDIENLQTELENALVSTQLIDSLIFKKELQKQLVKQVLPTAKEDVIAEINEDIEKEKEPEIDLAVDGMDGYLGDE